MTVPADGPPPTDGALPGSAAQGAAERAFGVYVHVPFCRVRCGYCDFTTYTATELGGGADQAAYARTATTELDLAARVLAAAGIPDRAASTVFIGGGTPTLLPPADLARVLTAVRDRFGLAPRAEVTVEANPDSVDAAALAALARAGVTRVSFGMQSAVPHVLATLDRTHDPRRVPHVVEWARRAGLAVSLDLIYGTPGESAADWAASLRAALACEPDHLSAYALVVESGTRLAARVDRGEIRPPDDDELADRYEEADEALSAAGFAWYEVSNWARTPQDACRHNLAYWTGEDWWGVGPGAHSHVGGVRWWNVRHPRAYASRLAAGASPAAGREILTSADRLTERVLLETRLSSGFPLDILDASGTSDASDTSDVSDGRDRHERRGRREAESLLAEGLLAAAGPGRVVLTRRGRLLADHVVRRLLGFG